MQAGAGKACRSGLTTADLCRLHHRHLASRHRFCSSHCAVQVAPAAPWASGTLPVVLEPSSVLDAANDPTQLTDAGFLGGGPCTRFTELNATGKPQPPLWCQTAPAAYSHGCGQHFSVAATRRNVNADVAAWLCGLAGEELEQVGAALWPDASSAQVRNNFHVTAHHLRKALGRADWLRFDRDRYQINAGVGGVIDFDAATFERQVGDELRRARRGQLNVDSLRAALATYRSAFADGEPYGDWHLEVRDQLARLHADGLETLGEALLNAERYDEAAPVFERLIRQEELHEDAYRALMICRARAGDRTAAMREYRRLESMVRKELESEPSKETSALFKKLQRGEAI